MLTAALLPIKVQPGWHEARHRLIQAGNSAHGKAGGRPPLNSTSFMTIIKKLIGVLSLALAQCALAQTAPVAMSDQRGFIDVFALREAVARLEEQLPRIDREWCETPSCERDADRKQAKFEKARAAFMRGWGAALLAAIDKGDELAEVIWRQCLITPVIERSALASTCDTDPARRQQAAQRLRQIGFEAAFDEETTEDFHARVPDQDSRRTLSQVRTLRQMEAGVHGGSTLDNYHGGNAPRTSEELADIRRAAVINAALTLVNRSFTYARHQGDSGYEAHAVLRLNRKPLGTPTLAWSSNVYGSGSLHPGSYGSAQNGFAVYLQYESNRGIVVGGRQDAQYLRMLHDTLSRSEKRIDAWLKRDPRWSVFLLRRQGHHEWVPGGMDSPFGRLDASWSGEWAMEKTFVNFKPAASRASARLKIRAGDMQTVARFEEAATPGHACELRYSGASSLRPGNGNDARTATDTVLGYLPAISPISPEATAPREAFLPLDPHKSYRQVLVQCPQGEWPDNRNKRFLFLANDTIVDVQAGEESRDLAIHHWRRQGPLKADAQFSPLAPPFDIQPLLDRILNDATMAEQAEAQGAQVRATVGTASPDELIASLAKLRLEKTSYTPSVDFPENLAKLVKTPDIAVEICATYRKHPPDALQRFNFMVVLNSRVSYDYLTQKEVTDVPDCLRLALNDSDVRVRMEALRAFARFAEEKDRAKLMELLNDPEKFVRLYSRDALESIEVNGKGSGR